MENAVGSLEKVGIKRNEKGVWDDWKLELVRYATCTQYLRINLYFVSECALRKHLGSYKGTRYSVFAFCRVLQGHPA